MSYDLESVKDTIREHPTETAAAVGVIAVLGTMFYFKSKESRNSHDHCNCNKIGWFSRWLEYRKARLQLQLASLKQ